MLEVRCGRLYGELILFEISIDLNTTPCHRGTLARVSPSIKSIMVLSPLRGIENKEDITMRATIISVLEKSHNISIKREYAILFSFMYYMYYNLNNIYIIYI